MANKILVDTSILIDLQKGQPNTIKKFDKLKEKVIISRITACEFIYGAKNKKEKKVNMQFIDHLKIVEVNETISEYTYSLLDKHGLATKLGIADAIIAATAIVKDLPLWTLNKKHFLKIKELELHP